MIGTRRLHRTLAVLTGAGLTLGVAAGTASEPAASKLPAPRSATPAAFPLYAHAEVLPIDLPTALRLADQNNPVVNLTRARVREALARLDQAQALWLPSLTAGGSYYRHDGQTQNQRGDVFGVSRSNAFGGGGSSLRLDVGDALFVPLVARRLTEAEAAGARAVGNNVQLEVASSYLDLLQVYAALAINTDTLARAEQMLEYATAADQSGMIKTRADLNRAGTEVALRRQERLDLIGRTGAVSARLARLLLLPPAADLRPVDPALVPLVLVPPQKTLAELIEVGLSGRPEISANRAYQLAAEERVRQAKLSPLLPRLQVDYLGGTFGGGRNSSMADFSARSDFTAAAYWELRNLGFGNVAQVRERRAVAEQTSFRVQEVEAQVGAEVSEAAKVAAARFQTLEVAQQGVREALEMYRKLAETSFGMVGRQPRYDALEVLLAIQALNAARLQYLAEVIEFNRTQFRLYAALGNPADCALETAETREVAVPVVPLPPQLARPPRPREKP